jgi:DNA-binding NarL/FixJ family response regulator
MYKLIIADDHNLVIDGYRAMLSEQKDIEIIKVVKDGLQLLNALKKQKPDLIILDLEMPNTDGFRVLEELQNWKKKPKVLVISLNDESTTIYEALKKGANGYLSKTCLKQEFMTAIYTVLEKGYFLDIKLKRKLIGLEKYQLGLEKKHPFTPMESAIMEKICLGQTHHEIAIHLNISEHTVDFHRRNIYKKSGVHNIADLMRYVIKTNFLKIQ